MEQMLESVLIVTGECTAVNTFDAAFRAAPPPLWADHTAIHDRTYSLHNLCPVPAEVLRRGHGTAGKLWCKRFWGCEDDLGMKSVLRRLSGRIYRLLTPVTPPTDAILYAAYIHRGLELQLVHLDAKKQMLYWHRMRDQQHITCQTPRQTSLDDALRAQGLNI